MGKFVFAVNSNVTTVVEGSAGMISRWLRVKDDSAKYTMAFQMHVWDGYVRFFDRESRSFPTGLLRFVEKKLKDRSIPYKLNFRYKIPETPPVKADFLNTVSLSGERAYQLDAINTCLKTGRGVVQAVTGSGKTACQAAIAGQLWLIHGVRTLVIVPKKDLLHQTADEMQRFLGNDTKVGMVGDGYRQADAAVVIATPQTLRFALPEETETLKGKTRITRKHEPILLNLIRSCQCLILDEAHHASGESIYQIGLTSPAVWRFGFSGTPLKGKKWDDLRLMALFDKIIYRVGGKQLVKAGILAKPVIHIIEDPILYTKKAAPTPDYSTAFRTGILKNRRYNIAIAKLVRLLVKIGKPPLIFTPRIPHVRLISRLLDKLEVPHETAIGPIHVRQRLDIKKRYKQGENFAIVLSNIWDEGTDVPNTYALVLAGGGKTHVALRQRIGRGMRRKGDDNRVLVFDFTHENSRMLKSHSDHRIRAYKKDGYEIIYIDDVRRIRSVIE